LSGEGVGAYRWLAQSEALRFTNLRDATDTILTPITPAPRRHFSSRTTAIHYKIIPHELAKSLASARVFPDRRASLCASQRRATIYLPALALEICRLRLWNVLDRARIPVKDHVVWEPVDFLVSVIIDPGKTDVYRAQILILD